MMLEPTLRLRHRLAADRGQLLHVRLARDVEHILPLVHTLALRVGARQHLLATRWQCDAVEVGQHNKDLRRDVGRDAEGGDHLEREQVHFRGVVAAPEELALWRLGHSLVARGLLLLRLELLPQRLDLPLQVRLLLEDRVDLEELALRLHVIHGVELL
eukprot:4734098-Prymnesium_polylepis.1